jgi:SagB-type dehydrogenase family enzyme
VLTDDGHQLRVSGAPRGRRTAVRYRRSPHLVAYWRDGSLRIVNYATRNTSTANTLVCELLDFCGEWRSLADISQAVSVGSSPLVSALLERLVSLSLVLRSDRPVDPRLTAMDTLGSWNPEAGFFHSASKDVRFWSPAQARRHARNAADLVPMPSPIKSYPGARTIRLPDASTETPFAEVVLSRRTSRRYSSVPVTLGELSTILALSAGVQHWATTDAGEVPLKTAPSGGARHPIECYVVVRAVTGLKQGIYHYGADRHVLERVRGAVSPARMRSYVPHSGYFADGSAMIFFTAAFERQLWRYPYSRAYRAALIEAGHVCQTLLLTATSLGLASYCVLGLADSLIERDLGIDGITESVVYCAGVGRPPRGTRWAGLTRGQLRTRPNPHVAGQPLRRG